MNILHLDKLTSQETPKKYFNLSDNTDDKILLNNNLFHKIIWITSGKTKICIEGKYHYLSEGDIVLINNNQVFSDPLTPINEYKGKILYINSEYLKKFKLLSRCFSAHILRNNNFLFTENNKNCELWNIIKALEEANFNNPNISYFSINNHLIRFLLSVNLYLYKTTRKNYHKIEVNEKAIKILEYANKNLTDDLSCSKIQEDCLISNYTITTYLKKNIGHSLCNYVKKKRLFHSSDLLRACKSSKDACYESGFRTYSCFFSAFKDEYGVSPQKYIKIIKNIRAQNSTFLL